MKRVIIFVLCAVFTCSVVTFAQEQTEQDSQETPTEGSLTVIVEGFKNEDGVALAMLYQVTDENAEKKVVSVHPFKKQTEKIVERKSEIVFEELSFGKYAVLIVHDENANGKVDHLFGPTEDLGFSNNYKRGFFSSPTLQELAFSLQEETLTLTIQMQ